MDFRVFEEEIELVPALCEVVGRALVERLSTAANAGLVVSGGRSVRAFCFISHRSLLNGDDEPKTLP